MTVSTKSFLGAGWAFPLRPVNGRLRYAELEDDVEQAIHIILLTERGERPMLPTFGGGLGAFLFEPNTPSTHRAIERSVSDALIDWEPRIRVERVEVVPDQEQPNLLLIQVDYVVRATNSFYNRVFPFYLLEGSA
ncbi:MAG: GPW/gp25 family protein [Cyanobacteriota bacterium]|nr:GPW/gp25 family protein [Cyanobacteriota bacterium]